MMETDAGICRVHIIKNLHSLYNNENLLLLNTCAMMILCGILFFQKNFCVCRINQETWALYQFPPSHLNKFLLHYSHLFSGVFCVHWHWTKREWIANLLASIKLQEQAHLCRMNALEIFFFESLKFRQEVKEKCTKSFYVELTAF